MRVPERGAARFFAAAASHTRRYTLGREDGNVAFISRTKRRGKLHWRIVWRDETLGAGREGRRAVDCATGDHREALKSADLSPQECAALAQGATTRELRAKLLHCYKALEVSCRRDAARAGGAGRGSRHGTSLLALLDRWLDDIRAEVEVRAAGVRREGKSPKTLQAHTLAASKFRDFLLERRLARITTGDLTAEHLREFKKALKRAKTASGTPLASVSVNTYLRSIRAFLNYYLDDDDPRPYFRLAARSVRKALGSDPTGRALPERFEPAHLATFLQAALDADRRASPCIVERRKGARGKRERFLQRVCRSPLFRWAAVLMLTGCRVQDAEGLRWEHVALDGGVIFFPGRKTGKDRELSLVARDPVSPLLLDLFRAWRAAEPDAEYVLPATSRVGEPQPVFPKRPWSALCGATGIKVRPKALRSNWVSYRARLGHPLSTIALEAGHEPPTLLRYYLALPKNPLDGDNLDDAMGVAPTLRDALSSV